MLLVGLSGGIACGKSTVSRLLAQAGFPIIDCDLIARDVVAQGRWGYRRVVRAFGPGVLATDGELDRAKVAELVFSDAAARRRLNSATHLPVLLQIVHQALVHWARCQPVAVIDMPLLFETGFAAVTRPRVLVACSPSTQLARLRARDGLDAAAAEARAAAQMPLARKRALADVIVENDGSRAELEMEVAALVTRLRRRAWLHRWLLSPVGLAAAAAALAMLL